MNKTLIYLAAVSAMTMHVNVISASAGFDNSHELTDDNSVDEQYENRPRLERSKTDQSMQLRVSGAAERIPLKLRTITPSVVRIAGSEDDGETAIVPGTPYRGYPTFPYKGPPYFIMPTGGQQNTHDQTQEPFPATKPYYGY